MKIKLDIDKLRQQMHKNGIKTYKQLAKECGFSFYTFQDNKNRRESISKEHLWLIAEYLSCDMKDLVYPDWEDGA